MSQNPGIGSSATITGTISTKTPLAASAPSFATVGTSSAQAVASNASRRGLVLINTSANTVSFGLGSNAAVLNSGITLVPNGVYDMSEFDYVTGAVNAIASGASSNLTIQEFV